MLVLDSGALSRLSQRTRRAAALIEALRAEGLWPPMVPTVVIAESTAGARRDAQANRLLKTCDIDPIVPERVTRRAGYLRARARRGSTIDALVVALTEPGGTVMTSDHDDLEALASYADDVTVEWV